MLAPVQSKVPHLPWLTRCLSAQKAKFVVMHKGAVVGEIDNIYGSQQEDPLGGHLSALSIYDFMLKLKDAFPAHEAGVSWIVVDDPTVSDKQGRHWHWLK